MTRTYQAVVTIEIPGSSRGKFRSMDERISQLFWESKNGSDAVVMSSRPDRTIRVLIAIDAASTSAAESTLDQIVRGVLHKVESESRFATPEPKEKMRAPLERQLALA